MMPAEGETRAVRSPPDPHTDRPLIGCLALALVLGLAAGTQYVAWRFHDHPSLGAPLVVVPAHAARWLRATGVLAAGTALVGVLLPWLRPLSVTLAIVAARVALASATQAARSEEHTSELQSPCNLVCRLLLEKKKKKK